MAVVSGWRASRFVARRRVGRVLRACLPGAGPPVREALEQLRPVDHDVLVAQALHHRVGAEVHACVAPVAAVPELAGVEEENVLRHLRALADLRAVEPVMTDLEVPWLVFKGPVLAERYRPRPGLRGYADLDVLVPRGNFPEVVRALVTAGCTLLDRNWQVIAAEERGQVHLALPLGTELDLHWDVVNRGVIRRAVVSEPAALFERARTVGLGDTRVPTFGVEDTLLHLLVHGGLAGANRLVWLRDVERVVAVDQPRWDVLVDRAARWRVRALVGAVLERAHEAAGVVVPGEVSRELLGSTTRVLTHAVDRLSPPAAATSVRTVGGLWVRTQRDTLAGGLGTAVGKAVRGPGLRRTAETWVTGRPTAPTGHGPHGALRPSGDAATRDRYLDGVAGAGVAEDG